MPPLLRPILALMLFAGLGGCALFDDEAPVRHHPTIASFPGGTHPRVVTSGPPQQCVPYARNHSGVGLWGDAYTWWRQAAGRFGRTQQPVAGSVIVIVGYNGPDSGHVAVVRRIINSRQIVVDHANWLNRGEVSLDSPVFDVSEDNDWSRVRVWYTPGQQLGARTYPVAGFILPWRLEERVASR